jgi:Mn-dependent DtxR family transcriptional regulator
MNEYTEMQKRVVKAYFDVREAFGDWHKQSQVAKHLNVSHGTVSKAVRELNGLGVMRGGHANIKVKGGNRYKRQRDGKTFTY